MNASTSVPVKSSSGKSKNKGKGQQVDLEVSDLPTVYRNIVDREISSLNKFSLFKSWMHISILYWSSAHGIKLSAGVIAAA